MKRNSQAQAALEYLMTYGWALIGLLAVVGALVYFGAGDTQSAIPASCSFGTEFVCDAFIAADDASFAFALKNNHRAAVVIDAVECTVADESWSVDFTTDPAVGVGETFVIVCDADDATGSVFASDKDKFDAKIYFAFNETEALPRAQSGSIIATLINKSSSSFQGYIADQIS